MGDATPDRRPCGAWFSAALIASLIGGVPTFSAAVWWLSLVSGHCGVVRFYEQASAVILLGGWSAGTAIGFLVVFIGHRKNSTAIAIGSVIVIMVNVVAVAVCAIVVHAQRAGDYSLKDTQRLLALLSGDDIDARKEAAHALGERKATKGVAPLCAILDNAGEDVNLRLNAATALGQICAPPRPLGVDIDSALTSLSAALGARDKYLPTSAAEALGRIGDVRAIGPLAALLSDGTRAKFAREDAARALGRIGGGEAVAALEKALPGAEDEFLAQAVRVAIAHARGRASDGPTRANR